MFSEREDAILIYKNRADAGGKAKTFKESTEWTWFKDTILKTLEDQAIQTLKTAKDEADRLKAQQMFLAAQKPEELLDFLITQGDAALVELRQFSTPQTGETGDQNA